MKSISKLKDDARKHELREEWEKAVQVYLQVLKVGEQGEGEVELPLYNRVGDLYVRLGRAQEAVRYYEQAADRYAEAGLYNNAIALCNKGMRYQPQNVGLLRKLGLFSALQGFYADARRYFVEYADKQIAQGRVDDALSALADFARIADDADSRELLGRRLHERGRTAEAVTELRTAHGMRVRAGQTQEAEALRREIRSIDPSAQLEQDRPGSRPPPASSYDAEMPGLSHFDAGPFGAAEADPSASGNVQLEDTSDAGYGLVDIGRFESDDAAVGDAAEMDFDTTIPADQALPGFFEPAEDAGAGADAFDLPLLPDSEGEDTLPHAFRVPGPDAPPGHAVYEGDELVPPGADELTVELPEFDDDEGAGFDLPLLGDTDQFVLPDRSEETLPDIEFEQFGEDDTSSVAWLEPPAEDRPALDEEPVAFDDFAGLDTVPTETSTGRGGFGGWPEDPDDDLGAASLPEVTYGEPPPAEAGDDALLNITIDDFGDWDTDASAVEDMGLELTPPGSASADAAAAQQREAERREAERREAERLEAERREAQAARAAAAAREAREAAARAAEAREAAAREAEAARAAREAEARAAAAREAEAREAAAREAAAREAAAREAAAREAAAREAEARVAAEKREADARAAAAAEAAAHDPWSTKPASPRAAGPPAAKPSATPRPADPARHTDSYVDLGSLFAEDEEESTRFRIEEALPTGDEDEDFAELLSRFKEKVAEHLPPEDAAAHYDLGLAFKEMGLIDEAIAEFQVALRTGHMRLKVYEELGYCFLHKQQYNIAEKVLRQALQVEHRHELDLLGIYYQLGRAYEAMGRVEQARDAYERVLGMDLHFQDTSERLARL
jgi:tetratricopeptide (TPR) repeat protein